MTPSTLRLLHIADDTNLLAPAAHLVGRPLVLPTSADLVVLANGPELTQRRLGSADGSFLARSTPQIRAHCHSNGANVIPTAAGCKKLLSFLRARPSIWHVDRAMQSEFVEAAGGVVFHAIPSLFGWLESESDIEGAGWVRPAHQVQ